ncbi:MAG: VWA domain-containing protein [Acidobacteriota bacterium]
MRFLSVSALWWLLISAIIIFFYLLKLKRKRRVVSSVFLWQRALEEIEANAPFRKLRRSLLLVLQLLALAALVFALARPLIKTQALAAGSSIIIIDSTASMSARDEDGDTRLQRAKKLANDMIASLGGNDRAAIIESSSRVTVRSTLTSDHAALRSAINQIQPTDAAGNLADALLLAEQLAKAERDAGIVVISDGGGSSVVTTNNFNSAQAIQRATATRLVSVGKRAQNLGIVAMNTRQNQATGKQELFASIANFSDKAATVNLELKIENRLADVRTANIAANERAAMVFDTLPATGGLAELRITGDEDDLAADNLAFAMLADSRRVRVAVVSDNPFLLQAIAVNSAVEARKLNSASAPLDGFDCVVTDGAISQEILAANKPLLAINPLDVSGYWQTTGQLDAPALNTLDRAHPANSYLSYADVHIETAAKRQAAAWLKAIAANNGDGLIFAGEQNKRRVVMLGFDLTKSDLPLKVEFPIFLANSLSWLAGRESLNEERAIRAGGVATIRAANTQAEITTPAGDSIDLDLREGTAAFADTLQVGLYEVKDAPGFAVSLLNESESNTTPREAIQTRAGSVSGASQSFSAEREIWMWIIVAVLALLSLEWWIYHKRIAV